MRPYKGDIMITRFMKYYKPYMKILVWVIIGTFAMAGLDLIFPIVVRNLINQVLPDKDMHRLLLGSAVLLVLYIINFIIQFLVQYYGHVMSASIEHDMRRDLFSHIEKEFESEVNSSHHYKPQTPETPL